MFWVPNRKRKQPIMAKLAEGNRILDIGCAALPNRYLRGEVVVGLDLNDMIVNPPYTEHIMGDVADIDVLLSGRRFDTVLMSSIIEHLERPYNILRLVHGHVNSLLILSTPNPLGIPVVVAEYLCLKRFYYTQEHVFYFSPRWVWRLLERSGYKVIKTIGYGILPASLSYNVIYAARPVKRN